MNYPALERGSHCSCWGFQCCGSRALLSELAGQSGWNWSANRLPTFHNNDNVICNHSSASEFYDVSSLSPPPPSVPLCPLFLQLSALSFCSAQGGTSRIVSSPTEPLTRKQQYFGAGETKEEWFSSAVSWIQSRPTKWYVAMRYSRSKCVAHT